MEKTDTIKLSRLPRALLDALRPKASTSARNPSLAERPMLEGDEEVTQRTDPDTVPVMGLAELDQLIVLLEPHFIQTTVPKLREKRVLYIATETLPHLSTLLEREPAMLVSQAPGPIGALETKRLATATPPCFHVIAPYQDTCFAPESFDVLILPETSTRGTGFFSRARYWTSLLRPGGDLLLSIAHPQSRFLLRARDDRHRTAKTATFERVFERVRELSLDIVSLRELTLNQIPPALLKKHVPSGEWLLAHGEVPLVLGLHVKKR